jgi:raffinose/stachyose/melibiose transport system substrate-binding protein
MKRKTVALVLMLILMAGSLFASGTTETTSKTSEPVTTLQFWTWRPEDVDFYAKQIALFEAKNPGIKVIQTAHKNTEYNTILAASLSGGAGPDVFQGRAYGGLVTFADSNYLEPLEQWLPELKNYKTESAYGW